MLRAIVFITGSTDGLGRAAAQSLLGEGRQVVLHARSAERAAMIAELLSRSAGIVVGDLRSAAETRSIADKVNAIGRVDAVIHKAAMMVRLDEFAAGVSDRGEGALISKVRCSRVLNATMRIGSLKFPDMRSAMMVSRSVRLTSVSRHMLVCEPTLSTMR